MHSRCGQGRLYFQTSLTQWRNPTGNRCLPTLENSLNLTEFGLTWMSHQILSMGHQRDVQTIPPWITRLMYLTWLEEPSEVRPSACQQNITTIHIMMCTACMDSQKRRIRWGEIYSISWTVLTCDQRFFLLLLLLLLLFFFLFCFYFCFCFVFCLFLFLFLFCFCFYFLFWHKRDM